MLCLILNRDVHLSNLVNSGEVADISGSDKTIAISYI